MPRPTNATNRCRDEKTPISQHTHQLVLAMAFRGEALTILKDIHQNSRDAGFDMYAYLSDLYGVNVSCPFTGDGAQTSGKSGLMTTRLAMSYHHLCHQ